MLVKPIFVHSYHAPIAPSLVAALYYPCPPGRPVLVNGAPHDVFLGQKAPDVRIVAAVSVIAQHQHHAERYLG
jgi:hypothetical protein